jgi:predicted nucleic acid-binding protein
VSGTIIYLDICALKRPFDDARSERIRREAEAVVSPAHRFENDRNPREDRRLATALWLQKAVRPVDAAADTDERARVLSTLGFAPLDALHLALAEKAEARWFVTTDDQLLRKAREQRDLMRVDVVTPDELVLDEESQE